MSDTAWFETAKPLGSQSAAAPSEFDSWMTSSTTVKPPQATDEDKAQALALTKRLSKNPDEVDKKLSLAKNAAPILGISAPFVYDNANVVAKRLYGPFENPGSASSKLENTVKAMPLNTKIATLQYQQLREGETPDRAQQIKDLQAQLPKDQVGGMPRFVIDAASSLGIQLGAGAVGSVTGMQAFGQGLLSKMWYVKLIPGASKALEEGAKKSLALSDEAVDTAMGSLIGGFYGELRDSGVGVKAARAASGVMLAAQTVLSALSAGKIPGVKQATEALAEASLKAVASGELARSIVIQAGKGYLEQGAIAALNNATGVLLPQFAKSLSNKVDGTDLTWDQANVIWNQFATGTLEQALAMGTVHAIGATVQGTRYAMEASKIAGEIDKTVEPSPTEAGGVKVASKGVDLGKLPNPEAERAVPFPPAEAAAAEAKAEAARTKIAKDEIAKTPISQLDVPRGTMKPTGAELASIENAPFERTSSERINDLATLEKNKVITEPQQAELDKLRSEQPAAMVSAKPPSTTERVESDPRMIKANQKVASLQDALDSARKEGKLSGVQDLAMEDALKSARQEARMTQDMLHKETTEKVKQGLVNERERVAAVAQSNQYVNNLKSLDLSHIGDEYKAPIKGILDQINLNKPTNKTLANLFDVQQQINSGVAPTSLPENYVNRLGELAKKPFRDLTLEEQKVVHDTIMAYHKAGVDSRTLLERGQAVDKQEALKALKWENIEAHPKETPKPGEFVKANTGLGSKIKSAIDHAKNSVSQYQTLVASAFGGEDSRGYQILGKAIDDGDDMRVAKSYEYSDPVVNWFKDNKLDMGAWLNETKDVDIEGFKGKLQRGQEIALAGIAAQEEGRASLLESGFSLQGDSVLGRKYKLTEASLDKLLSDMDPKEKELLGKIFDMGKRAGKDMKDTFRRMYGYDMDTLDNYYPLHRAEHKLPTEEEILHQRNSSSFTRAGVDKSHTISRVGSHNAVWLRNAGDDIMEMADSASTFVGLGEPVRNASKVLFDKDFSDHLKTQMGDNFYKQITEGLQAIAGNKKVFNGLDKWFINVRNRGIGAVLGFNFPTGAINRVLVERSLAGYVPAGDWTKGQAFVAIHPKSTHEYLMANVPLYRQIAERGLLPEMQDVSRGTGKVLDKIQKASMVPEKLGFTGATKGEMWSAITQLRREMKEGVPSQHVKRALGLTEDKFPTMTEAEKIKAEAAYAGYVTKRTHANPREMYRQNMTREGIVGLTLSTLMSEKNALLNLGIRKAMDIHTPGGGRAFAKYLAVGVFGEALAIAGIRGLANDIGQKITGKKNKTPIGERVGEELSQNTLGLIPGVAQAVYPLERAMSGTSLPVQTSPDLVSQFGDDIIATAQHVHLAMNTKNPRTANKQWGDAFDSFMSWALPLTMKIPYKHGIGDIVGAAKNMGDNP